MKKLFFGILVALFAFAFSAFTTKVEIYQSSPFYYLGADGNYHKYTGLYNPAKCGPISTTYCIYRWYVTGDPNLPEPMTPELFNALVLDGKLIPDGTPNRRFIP